MYLCTRTVDMPSLHHEDHQHVHFGSELSLQFGVENPEKNMCKTFEPHEVKHEYFNNALKHDH